MASALTSHPSSRVHALQLASAKAGLDGARWQFYPTPSVAVEKASTSATDISYQGDATVTTLRLQQPLWTGGRLTGGLQKAQATVTLNQAALDEVNQQLALRVVQGYSDWLGAHLKIVIHEKSLSTLVRLHTQVKHRIEQGVSSESDLILAVARLESLASDISVARTQQDIALARLGQLLGRPVASSSLSGAIAKPHALKSDLQILIDQAQASSPSLQKAQAQAQIQAAALVEKRAELSPDVYIRAEQQYGNFAYRNAPDERRLFIGLSSRFGAGLSSLANVETAQAQYQAALAEVEVQGRTISELVSSDYALAVSTQDRLSALHASLKAAEEVSNSYDRQFLSGRKSWLDVMNAARELAQTEVQLADIESTQILVSWRLALETQGLSAVLDAQP